MYSRSGATPLQQQDCLRVISFGRFQGGATPLLRDCVRVNSFGTGSQHIPDLEQNPYHMLVNSFVKFDNPDLRQHRCYGTVYGSIRFIMYYYDFFFFLRCLHPLALDIAFISHFAMPSFFRRCIINLIYAGTHAKPLYNAMVTS